MNNKKLFIDLSSKKYNFILKKENVKKIKIILPFFSYVSCELNVNGSEVHLKIFDKIACYYLGDRKQVFYRNSLNPFSKTIRVIIPDNITINLNACNQKGNIYLENINFDRTELNLITGNVKIKQCNAETAIISGISSNVEMFDSFSTYLDIKTVTGNVEYINSSAALSKLKTEIGNCVIELPIDDISMTTLTIESENLSSIIPARIQQKLLEVKVPYGNFTSNIL